MNRRKADQQPNSVGQIVMGAQNPVIGESYRNQKGLSPKTTTEKKYKGQDGSGQPLMGGAAIQYAYNAGQMVQP